MKSASSISDIASLMAGTGQIHILGCGAVGWALAAYLASEGRDVVAVRTSRNDLAATRATVTVHTNDRPGLKVSVKTVSLSQLGRLEGMIVVASKSYANVAIASELADRAVTGPIVILQNGLSVEQAFLASLSGPIYRCVLYMTGQMITENEIAFRSIASSPIGILKGTETGLAACTGILTTPGFPFHAEQNIQREIWRKTIINAVFNSICPLLDVDNGIFARNEEVSSLAGEIVNECILLAEGQGITLTESELIGQIMKISRGSDGVLISTLQDIRSGRETEIDFLNLEMARIASSMAPKINLGKTELLGKMVLAKSRCLPRLNANA